jgi:hypothetical protein
VFSTTAALTAVSISEHIDMVLIQPTILKKRRQLRRKYMTHSRGFCTRKKYIGVNISFLQPDPSSMSRY